MTADPVSWMLIEPGWDVVAADGSDVGRVDAVTGDENADIFNGLAISAGLARPRYVPAESVARIVEGRVELALSADAVVALPEYTAPAAQEQILPDSAGTDTELTRRVHWWQNLFRRD